MTAQAGDEFCFDGDNYSIVAISSPISFHPSDYGIEPSACCTACWNGYWCKYEISGEGIRLKDLYIHSKDDRYPEIHGVTPEKKGGKPRLYMGHCCYKNLDIPMDYTGKILAGNGFLREYYIHMGYQEAWAYKVLKELVFEHGKLVETVDHSDMAERFREEQKENGKKDRGTHDNKIEIAAFVDHSFSLEWKDKAWWIN